MSFKDCAGKVGSLLRRAPETLGLCRLPLPVPLAMGRDEAPVAGVARQGSGDRSQTPGRVGFQQVPLPASPVDTPDPGVSARKRYLVSGRTEKRVLHRVRGAFWSKLAIA